MKTPVEELFDKLWETDKDKLTWHSILKEVLKKESISLDDSYGLGWKHGTQNIMKKLNLQG